MHTFLEVDTLVHELKHQNIKNLFVYYKLPLSSTSLAYSIFDFICENKMKEVRKLLFEKEFFLVVDESSKEKYKYVAIVIGSIDHPFKTYFILFKYISLSQTGEEIVKTIYEILRRNGIVISYIKLLISDSEKYM